jgi:hypothetical protein
MPEMQVGFGYRVAFEAVDPTTGAAVAGVTVSAATIFVRDEKEPELEKVDVGPFMYVNGPDTVQ